MRAFVENDHDGLFEVFTLLRQQEQALWKTLSEAEEREYALRSERINILLDEIASHCHLHPVPAKNRVA